MKINYIMKVFKADMLHKISSKLTETLDKLTNKDEKVINSVLQELELSLVDCDVSQAAAKAFIDQIRKNKQDSDNWLGCVHKSLVQLLSSDVKDSGLNLKTKKPAVVLMVGIQGVGKTTTTAKLAIKYKAKHKVLVCSTDIYRPAAMEQLKILLSPHDIEVVIQEGEEQPLEIAQKALAKAKSSNYDILIIDTAGRQHDKTEMMKELHEIQNKCSPIETLMTVDGMAGNFAVESTKEFSKHVTITGFILTKMDGDQKGGAAISITYETNLPVKYIGNGEQTDKIDVFDADRFAKIILDLGDQTGFIEKLQDIDLKQQNKLKESMKSGQFDFNQYLEQIEKIDELGGAGELLGKLPGTQKLMANKQVLDQGEKNMKKTRAMILSMTAKERSHPALLENKSRRRRIIRGSAADVRSFNMMMKQFKQMQKMMSKLKGKGLAKLLKQLEKGS